MIGAGTAIPGEPDWSWGAFHFRWRTTGGKHGHTGDCRTPECDRQDFARGNLDNSFGLRAGLETAIWRRGHLSVFAGTEMQVMSTEFNLSQRDLLIGELDGVGGVSFQLGAVKLVAKGGAGGVLTSDGAGGIGRFIEAGFETPASSAAGLRWGFRRAWHAGPSTDEVSLSLVVRPDQGERESRWAIGWSAGLSFPGLATGRSRSLSTAPTWQLAALRSAEDSPWRFGFAVGSTSHESTVRTNYGEVPGNQRGKEIFDFAILADRLFAQTGAWSVRAGGGLRAARWEDRTPLLLGKDGRPIDASTELAALVSVAARIEIGRNIGLTGRAEQVYWPSLRLGELRFSVGLEAGSSTRRGEAPPAMSQAHLTGLPDHPSYSARIIHDFHDLVRLPRRMSAGGWRKLAFGTAAVGLTALADDDIRTLAQHNRTPERDRWVNNLRPLSNQAGAAALIGLIWLGGAVADEPVAIAIGQDALEATLFTSLLIVPPLKAGIGRSRPGAGLGNAHFRPFSGNSALPSGEAAPAFALASVVAVHARSPWIKAVSWGLAGFLSCGRVYLDRHWASDVVAGALIGSSVGSWVAHRRDREDNALDEGVRIAVAPAPGGIQLIGGYTW
ncbi:MAG: phosphatase PAP2 family protein [Acidobacteria bacterium]|nr:phosphatase PAP2 family protein [Acidobacteriota bacterium]